MWLNNKRKEDYMNLSKTQEHFQKVLAKAQKERAKRQNSIPHTNYLGVKSFTLEWIIFEIQTMTDAVNQLKQSNGDTNLVTFADVERVEAQACGHSDYSRKFAFYCSELINKSSETVAHNAC